MNASTDLAKRDAVAEVCTTIASTEFAAKVEQALPPGVTLDRFTRTTLTAVQQNPEVVLADRQSLYNSVIRAAQDGLVPDGREAALVVFSVKGEKKVQYLPMVFGLRKKAAEHGFSLAAYVVYQNDEFDWQLGMDPSVHHKPPRLGEDRGEPVGAYAVGTDKRNGEKYLEVMSLKEIEQVRAVSRAATSEYGPWVKWWSEQARKTVAKRLFKQLPLGAVDESTIRVLEAIDAEYDLKKNGAMTVDEANVAAPLSNLTPPGDDGPDDGEWTVVETGPLVEAANTFVPAGPFKGKTLAQVADTDEAATFFLEKLRTLGATNQMRPAVELFVEHRLPDVWAEYREPKNREPTS